MLEVFPGPSPENAALRVHATVAASGRERPAVVALPGLGLSGDYLVPLALALAPELRTYVVDPPRSGSAQQLAKLVDQWLEANGLDDVVLYGNSFGSEIALEAALLPGTRVRGVVLGAPTPDPSARSFARQAGRLAHAAALAPPRMVAIAARDYARTGLRRLLRQGRAALAEPIEKRLPLLGLPALVVRGSRDPVVPQRWAEQAARLARAELAVVEGAAHACPFSHPAELAGLIVEFSARI